jgi:hypothetical protein
MLDHYADAVFSEPGRCWRMVHTSGAAYCPIPNAPLWNGIS